MRKGVIIWVLLLFASSVAWKGPACSSSLRERKPCCVQCPFRTLPKLGDSCCDRGAENGSFLVAFASTPQKPAFLATSFPFPGGKLFVSRPEPLLNDLPEISSLYLFEEHLLL